MYTFQFVFTVLLFYCIAITCHFSCSSLQCVSYDQSIDFWVLEFGTQVHFVDNMY